MDIQAVRNELRKVIMGKDEVLDKVLICILSKGHVLLEDTPGTGKTTMALAFSKVFDLNYRRIQFTSDTMPSDVTGFNIYNRATNSFEFKEGPIFTNMLLADEINRTSPKTQSALLEAMEEHKVTIDGVTNELDEPFFVIATQNPYGSAGTNLLPQAQMDRFLMALSIGYPSRKDEINILKSRQKIDPLTIIKSVANKEELLKAREEIDNVFIEDSIYGYIVDLADATRKHEFIDIGCSPRGEIAIMRLAKAHAYINGYDYVRPVDVNEVFVDACVHRIVLKTRDQSCVSRERKNILNTILANAKMPNVEVKR